MRVLGRHKPADSFSDVQMDASSPAAASQRDARFEEGLIFWQDGYASRPGHGMLVLEKALQKCRQDSVSPGEATVLTSDSSGRGVFLELPPSTAYLSLGSSTCVSPT
jgi:hypothetical protein